MDKINLLKQVASEIQEVIDEECKKAYDKGYKDGYEGAKIHFVDFSTRIKEIIK